MQPTTHLESHPKDLQVVRASTHLQGIFMAIRIQLLQARDLLIPQMELKRSLKLKILEDHDLKNLVFCLVFCSPCDV